VRDLLILHSFGFWEVSQCLAKEAREVRDDRVVEQRAPGSNRVRVPRNGKNVDGDGGSHLERQEDTKVKRRRGRNPHALHVNACL